MTELEEINFSLTNPIKEKITGNLIYPKGKTKLPAVFILHGFKGFKEWGFIPYITEQTALSGAIAVRFNFSLNGMDKNAPVVDFPEKFAANTVTQEIADAKLLIDSFINGEILDKSILDKTWNGEIYLVGHSMGGGISILLAAQDKRINKIATWAAIANFDRYTTRQKKIWKNLGFIEFLNNTTGQMLRINLSFLNDMEDHKRDYNLPDAISKLDIPVLIVHGTQDMTVPLREAEMLAAATKKDNLKISYIERTGHTFGIEYPFKETTQALEKALSDTLTFFGIR